MTPRPEQDAAQAARQQQLRAANPSRSVVLRASAGSGKTKVLVDRFVRLCVEVGPNGEQPAHPRSILAVTFTRKAAVEIQERLLQRAAALALADKEELTAMLADLFGDRDSPRPKPAELNRAARLYERILEDVSALNVGTIHSFCQTILNRFAVDAGLDPKFSVIEDRQELVDETLDQLAVEIAAQPQLAAAAGAVADNPDSVRLALAEFFNEQMRIQRWLDAVSVDVGDDRRPPRTDLLPTLLADLRGFLFPDPDPAAEPREVDFLPALRDTVAEFAGSGLDAVELEIGADGAATLAKNLKKLRDGAAAWLQTDGTDTAAAAEIVLTKAGKVRSFSSIKKDLDLKELFQLSVTRQALPLLAALRRMKYLALYEKNKGRLRLGLRALDVYDELKRRDRVVDFQDLEDLARRLMGDRARAISLLYRLDDSITHILLDEFQDTNFNQWEILEPFIDDFLAGGSGDGKPTVFFVGDVKQSIYAFRGAEPDLFREAERRLEERGESLTLPTNFRSLGAVVRSAGCLFGQGPLGEFLDDTERENLEQLWSRREATGQVIAPAPCEDEEDGGRNGHRVAAETAARIVREMVDGGETTWAQYPADPDPRPLDWQDVLVLCRTRTEIGQYEKAFRDARVPIAPSGRGMLAASREVQDILALLRWLVFPSDDVALATVLRSPLFRIGEADLQAVLARRGLAERDADGRLLPPRGLWRTLRREPDDPVTGRAVTLLNKWRKNLDFLDCHAQLRRIYREGEVLERFGDALGDQARYNLLRLFDLAAGAETASAPTLRRLAGLIEKAGRRGGQDEGQLPRGGGRGRVRFMTIHGSKGLEAPVVLLVDADRLGDKESPRVRIRPQDADSPVLFGVTKEYREPYELPAGLALPPDNLQLAARAARERGAREEAHLLYVALTRARDRLFVLGGDKKSKKKDDSEHDSPLRRIRRAAVENGCEDVALELPYGPGTAGDRPDGAEDEATATAGEIRIWQPPVLPPTVREVTPSDVGEGSIAPPPGAVYDDTAPTITATERGTEVHLLLQLAAEQGKMPPGSGARHAEAAAVFTDPALGRIFRPQDHGARGLSEVQVVHRRTAAAGAEPQRITGEIDRLIVADDRVDIVDYKTNRTGGDTAHRDRCIDHYRPQLALYRETVEALYSGREVRTWLLFTDPQLDAAERLKEC